MGNIAGKLIVGGLVLTGLIAGIAIWYLQIYAFYEEVKGDGVTDVQLTSVITGEAEPILYSGYKAIDAGSSPIRYRACFLTEQSQALLTETYEVLERAEPRVAPGWFDCFDAEAIGEDLVGGSAVAFMGTRNIEFGIDRIVAVYPDGRGYVWHQINECGDKAYDGSPLGADCPDRNLEAE